jgi:hypothetical protein
VAINQESERDLLRALSGNMPVTITINPALNNQSRSAESLTTASITDQPISLSMLESIFKPDVLEKLKLLPKTSETFIYLAMIRIMVRRLA